MNEATLSDAALLELAKQFALENGVRFEESTSWELEWDPAKARYELAYAGKVRHLRWFVTDSRWCRLDWRPGHVIVSCNEGYRHLGHRDWDVPAGADADTYWSVLSEAKRWADDTCRTAE